MEKLSYFGSSFSSSSILREGVTTPIIFSLSLSLYPSIVSKVILSQTLWYTMFSESREGLDDISGG